LHPKSRERAGKGWKIKIASIETSRQKKPRRTSEIIYFFLISFFTGRHFGFSLDSFEPLVGIVRRKPEKKNKRKTKQRDSVLQKAASLATQLDGG
jgi:hypothetical protein